LHSRKSNSVHLRVFDWSEVRVETLAEANADVPLARLVIHRVRGCFTVADYIGKEKRYKWSLAKIRSFYATTGFTGLRIQFKHVGRSQSKARRFAERTLERAENNEKGKLYLVYS